MQQAEKKLPKGLQNLFGKKNYLVWWVKDKKNLSLKSSTFAILNYGDFDDVQKLFKEAGIKKIKRIFENQLKKRNNYDKKVIHYFQKYFQKHA